ncbi:MAG: glyoxalase, partial [Burkholderiales bacterium]|nr:glyoxalase [Burkholderiales bacterium]
PANNVFCYFIGPGGFVIEYTSEVEQVDENYKAGTPQDWTWPPRRIDRWGIHRGPIPEMRRAETAVGFPEKLFTV